jgi:hypothetical protein
MGSNWHNNMNSFFSLQITKGHQLVTSVERITRTTHVRRMSIHRTYNTVAANEQHFVLAKSRSSQNSVLITSS